MNNNFKIIEHENATHLHWHLSNLPDKQISVWLVMFFSLFSNWAYLFAIVTVHNYYFAFYHLAFYSIMFFQAVRDQSEQTCKPFWSSS